MALILLREQFITNAAGAVAPFTKVSEFYDDVDRKPYTTQADAQTNTPRFEMVKDASFSQFAYAPGKTMTVYYDGNGSWYTRKTAGVILNNLNVKLGLLPAYVSASGASDACVDITGQYGQPPYRITLTGSTGAAAGYSRTATSVSELFPQRFYNLPDGQYGVVVTDALNRTDVDTLTVGVDSGKGRATLLYENATAVVTATIQWSYNALGLVLYNYNGKAPSTYTAPAGTLIDGYLVNNGATWRRAYAKGTTPSGNFTVNDFIYFEDTPTAQDSRLSLHNLIYFHPDTPAEQNGGIVVEMTYSHGPLAYVLTGTVAGSPIPSVTNATGLFDGLAAGSYDVTITDTQGKVLVVPVLLQNRYGKRWQLDYDDLYSTPLRLELWQRGYTGAADDLCLAGTPVEYSSDGLNSALGGQGDIPPVIGSEVKLNFLVDTDLFEPVITSSFTDRFLRADIYYNNLLEWRGFVRPDSYDAPLLSGPQAVSLTATDGLAALKDTFMTGHEGQRLIGHRQVLYTILHCLSRTDVALGLQIFVNRRELSMDSTEAPELSATTNRTGYWKEDSNEPIDQRQVLDSVVQLLGGTLVQREGTWQIRSALEASRRAPGRRYKPAGTPLPARIAPAPLAAIEPPGFKRLYWLNASQYKNVRAGWKSLTGKTDTGWLENAYVPGKAFSDRYAWLGNGTGTLRPVSGWRPVVGQPFPLTLVSSGAKGKDYTTRWPRSLTGSSYQATPVLLGPPLPLAAGLEAVPATLQVKGNFVPAEYYVDGDGQTVIAPTNGQKAILGYEVVVDGRGAGVQFVEFALGKGEEDKDITASAPLSPLPSGTVAAEMRLYTWYSANTQLLTNSPRLLVPGTQIFKKGETLKYDFGTGTDRLFVARKDTTIAQASGVFAAGIWPEYFAELTATNAALGSFYLSEVGVQLTPQNATWEGEDYFRADGPAGNIRPTEELEVFHADPPRQAGLFSGNLYAFAKATGLVDGTIPTSWARSVDLLPSPLFESNVLDGIALRANPSRLVVGDLHYENKLPPRLLDTLDAPYDGRLAGRRFLVIAVSPWDMKAATASVSLVEIGRGQGALNPFMLLPTGARALHNSYPYLPGQYARYARTVHGGGVRVVQQ